MKRTLTLAAAASIAVAALWAGTARALPIAFTYSGFLLDAAGNPVPTATGVTFGFFDTEFLNTSTPNYEEPLTVTPSGDGYFSAIVGSSVPSTFLQGDVWLSLKVGTESYMAPRIRLTSPGVSPTYVFTSTTIPAGTCNHFFDGLSCPAGTAASGVGCYSGTNNVVITNQYINGDTGRCGWCNNTASPVTAFVYTFCVSSP